MSRPVAWFRVVRASTVLPWSVKAVWEEIRMMDQGQGCWMTAARIGARLGLAARTIETARQDLHAAGLLDREGKPPKVIWSVNLPASCRPTSQKPADPDVLASAKLLDDYLRPLWGIDPGPDRALPTVPTGHLTVVRSDSSVREGGRGEGSTLKSFQRLADSPLITKFSREKNCSEEQELREKSS